MIKIKDLNVSYNNIPVLTNVNLEIPDGVSVGIIGPNGAGKSTFLKAILGLIKKDTGNISIDGMGEKDFRKKVAYVPQRSEIDLSFPITVGQVVLTGTYPNMKVFQRPGKKEKLIAQKALEKVGLTEYSERAISDLSGGQLQRVYIARALAQEADYYFLDEPFVGIDMVSEKIIIDIIRELRDQGKTIVIVHHDLHKVTEYFDQLILVNRGVEAYGDVEDTFTTDNIKKAYGNTMGDITIKGVEK
ncbi:metal ABC transporter ATP-binding protein [Floricoccus penangensis]|uniref:metal ABC transporter ATP-binding protein n=1 Tax=Floricoccus penangensis TaxID=1859475 RepID=UPI00203CC03D|nr:metal ABC transporter ATP-binding protein [Floricoccus penangensis]URZ87276.1 metal ABC transporter ATP-binding protein [Floricoccus penangensis]